MNFWAVTRGERLWKRVFVPQRKKLRFPTAFPIHFQLHRVYLRNTTETLVRFFGQQISNTMLVGSWAKWETLRRLKFNCVGWPLQGQGNSRQMNSDVRVVKTGYIAALQSMNTAGHLLPGRLQVTSNLR